MQIKRIVRSFNNWIMLIFFFIGIFNSCLFAHLSFLSTFLITPQNYSMCLCVSHRPLTNEMPFFIVIIIDYLILRRWSERKKRSEKKCFSSIGSLWMIAFVAFQIVFKGYWSTMKYGKSNWEKYRKRKKKLPENICVHTIIWMVIRICGFFLVIVCV